MPERRDPAGATTIALRWRVPIALILIVAAGAWVRVDDINTWRVDAERFFVDGAPLLLNPDGYHYLALARDLIEGDYDPVDTLRSVPEGVARPVPPPPLSLVTAALAAWRAENLLWSAALLPVVLGPLLALPVFLIGRRLMGDAAGVSAALIAVLSHYYVYRTTLGFHDTDALNVTLASCVAAWGLYGANQAGRVGRGWLAAGAFLFAAWAWWWAGAYSVVAAVMVWTLVTALAAARAPPAAWGQAAIAGLLVGVAGLLATARTPSDVAAHLLGLVRYVGKADSGDFPNTARSTGEQVAAGISQAAETTLGDPVLLALSMVGLVLLLIRRPGSAAALLPLLVLAAAGVLLAQRFLIFAAPVTGLGIGALVALGLGAAQRRRFLQAAVLVGSLAAAGPSLYRGLALDFTPSFDAEQVRAMQWVAENAPSDAVVWSIWEHGYAVRYFARRAIVNDGSAHSGERTVYTALPFASSSEREAANYMRFYAVHGLPGMRRLHGLAGGPEAGLALARDVFAAGPGRARAILQRTLTAGSHPSPDELIAFLFPARAPTLLLLVDRHLLRGASWWYRYGTWRADGAPAVEQRMLPFAGLKRDGNRIVGPRLEVDLVSGNARLADGTSLALSRSVVATPRGPREQTWPVAGPEFHLFPPAGVGVLQTPALAATLASRALILRTTDTKYMRAAKIDGITAQIWHLRPDPAGN